MKKQLQEILFEYFKDFHNETIVAFIESFVYHLPAKKEGLSKLIEKFLKDNGLEEAYTNCMIDFVVEKNREFFRSSNSQRSMISDVTNALLNISFDRLRRINHSPITVSPTQVRKQNTSKVKVLATSDVEKKLNHTHVKKYKPSKVKVLGTSEVEKGVHVLCNINEDYTLCSLMVDGDMIGETEDTNDKCDCKQCLSIINYCKKIEP